MNRWAVFTNTDDNHFKYWSAQLNEHETSFTGLVHYGRIDRQSYQTWQYEPSQIMDKIQEKERKGYIRQDGNSDYPRPIYQDINRSNGMNIEETPIDDAVMGHSRPTPRPRVPTPEPTPRATPSVSVPTNGIPKYETNSDGRIKRFRNGYERPLKKTYTQVGKDTILSDRGLTMKINKFYSGIPKTSVYKKHSFGFDSDNRDHIFGIHSHGHYLFVMDDNNNPIGGYEIRRNGGSDFLYVKTSQTDYTYVLKYMLNVLRGFARSNMITLKVKGKKIVDALDNIFPNTKKKISGGYEFKVNRDMTEVRRVSTTNMRFEE